MRYSLALLAISLLCLATQWGEEKDKKKDGRELIGKKFASLDGLRWLDGEKRAFADSKLTLVRWLTDACQYCEESLPALEELAKKYDKKDLQFVAIYHPKPPGQATDGEVGKAAKALKLTAAVAIDEKWELLKKIWLNGAERTATSVTFLVDQKGVIQFVHPGPRIHRSKDPEHAEADAAMKGLENLVEKTLKKK